MEGTQIGQLRPIWMSVCACLHINIYIFMYYLSVYLSSIERTITQLYYVLFSALVYFNLSQSRPNLIPFNTILKNIYSVSPMCQAL